MSSLENSKQEILSFVKSTPEPSFFELERILRRKQLVETQESKMMICHPQYKNIVLWITDNHLLAKAIKELIHEKRVIVKSCNVLIYALDGKLLSLPIAKKIHDYKEPHWLPVIFS